jgi:hypothetical protein
MHPCPRCGGSLYEGERDRDCAHLIECRQGTARLDAVAGFIRAQLDITHRTTPQADALENVLRFVEGG